MVKMGLRQKAISLTRDFTTQDRAICSSDEASFCLEHCPHKTCAGDCQELKAFKKSLKKVGKRK